MASGTEPQKFSGASKYVLDEELAKIVNISMSLEMPLLLLKGEPGTGKTMLAHAIAEAFEMRLIVLNVKSSMKLIDALYQYDTLTRLNDSRFGDSNRDVSNIEEYIKMGKIGQAFVADKKVVLLIDEIDKADTDFQDDMLDVLDQMEFDIIEIDKTVTAQTPAGDHYHLQCQERPVRSLSGPLQLSPYRLSGTGHDAADHPGPFPGHRPGPAGQRGPDFLPSAGNPGDRKKTGHPGTDQLDPGTALRSGFQSPKDLVKGEVPFLGVLFKKSPDYVVAQNRGDAFQSRAKPVHDFVFEFRILGL